MIRLILVLAVFTLTACTSKTADDTAKPGDADTDTDNDAVEDTGTADTGTDPAGGWSPGEPQLVHDGGESYTGSAVWIVDTDGDGFDDLVTGAHVYDSSDPNYGGYEVSLHRSRGDGTFDVPVSTESTQGYNFQLPTLMDITGDGQMDVVAPSATGVSVFVGTGSGFVQDIFVGNPAETVAWSAGDVDLDADGTREAVVLAAQYDSTTSEATGMAMVFGPDSTGTYGFTQIITTDISWGAPAIAVDFEGDGTEAGLFADQMTGTGLDYTLAIYESGGEENLMLGGAYQTRYSNDGTQFGFGDDTNGDGAQELISSGVDGLQLYDPAIGHATILRENDFSSWLNGMVGFDLDGNGQKDALEMLTYYESDADSVTSGNRVAWTLREGEFGASQQHDFLDYTSSTGPNTLAAGDVNGDGCGDMAFLDGWTDVQLSLGDCGA